MGGWTLFLCLFGLAMALILLVADARRRQHERLQMERMRSGPFYYELYPMVLFARRHDLDRVQVERNRVTFYGMCPPGKMCEYVLSDHDFRPLTRENVRTLALVLAEDIPDLQQSANYRLRRYPVIRPNGIKDYGYLYTVRSRYKTIRMYERRHVRLY